MQPGQFIIAFAVGVSTPSIQCIAQPQQARSETNNSPGKHAIVLYGGVAVPAGSFAASSDENSSFALTGIALGARFAASVMEDWEITGGITCSYHRYDESAEEKVMRDSLTKYTVHAGGYFLTMFLAGVRYDILSTSHLTLFSKVQTGALICSHPEIREDNITPSGSGRRTISAAIAISTALDVGFEIVTNNGWLAGVSYIIGNPSFKHSVYEAHGTTPTAYFTKRNSQTVAIVQLQIGYSIDL